MAGFIQILANWLDIRILPRATHRYPIIRRVTKGYGERSILRMFLGEIDYNYLSEIPRTPTPLRGVEGINTLRRSNSVLQKEDFL